MPHDVSNAVTGAGGTGLLPPVIKDGTYAMAYVPTGRSFKVRMDVIQGAKAIAWWYIPRTGEAEKIGVYPTEDIRSFTPPTPGEHLG